MSKIPVWKNVMSEIEELKSKLNNLSLDDKNMLTEIEAVKSKLNNLETIINERPKSHGRPKKDPEVTYYQSHRDKVLQKKKEYYKQNADKRKEYQKQRTLKMKQEKYKAEHDGSLDGFPGVMVKTKKTQKVYDA